MIWRAFQQRQVPSTLDPVVLAELLVDHEVGHGLAEHGVGDFSHELLLVG
jgi:hypothetical protein